MYKSNCSKNNCSNAPSFPINNNRTLYVDSKYGNNGTGERENPNLPYQDLYFALDRAIEGDLIYVRPGEYCADGLVLKNKVDWFFENNAMVVNSTSTSTFVISCDTKCTISGYGVFYAGRHFVNHVKGIAKLNIEGELFCNENSSLFNFSSKEDCHKSKILINGNYFECWDLISVNSDIRIILNFDQIDCCNNIVEVEHRSRGKLLMSGNSIYRDCKRRNSSGFYFKSDHFDVDVLAQEYINRSLGEGYAVSILVPGQSQNPAKFNFNIQTFDCLGGAVSSFSSSTSPDPVVYPELTFDVDQVTVTYTSDLAITTSPFLFYTSVKLFTYNILTVNIVKSYSVFDLNNSDAVITGQVANISFSNSIGFYHHFINLSNNSSLTYNNASLEITDGGFFRLQSSNLYYNGEFVENDQTIRPITSMVMETGPGEDSAPSSAFVTVQQMFVNYVPGPHVHTAYVAANSGFNINFQDLEVEVSSLAPQNTESLFHIDGNMLMNGSSLTTQNAKNVFYTGIGSNINVNLEYENVYDSGGYFINGIAFVTIQFLNCQQVDLSYVGESAFTTNNVDSYLLLTIQVMQFNFNGVTAFAGLDGYINATIQAIESAAGTGFLIGQACELVLNISDYEFSDAGHPYAFDISGIAYVNCKNLNCSGTANGINLSGTGTFLGSVENFVLNDGIAVNYLSSGNMNLTFENITKSPISHTIILGSSLMTITGTGAVYATGQSINVSDTDTVFNLDGSLQPQFTLKAVTAFLDHIHNAAVINSCSGEIDIDELSINNTTQPADPLNSGFTFTNPANSFIIKGIIHTVDGQSVRGNPIYINVNNSSRQSVNLDIDIDYITNISTIINYNSSGSLSLKTIKLTKDNPISGPANDVPVISLNSTLIANVTLDGNSISSNSLNLASGSEGVITVNGNVNLISNWKNIVGFGSAIYIASIFSVWHFCQQMYSSNAAAVSLACPSSGITSIPTVGGYMNCGTYNVVVEIYPTTNQYPGLRLLSSMLITLASSLQYSIQNDGLNPTLPVYIEPSSANYTFDITNINLYPAAAFFVDPNLA